MDVQTLWAFLSPITHCCFSINTGETGDIYFLCLDLAVQLNPKKVLNVSIFFNIKAVIVQVEWDK